MIPDNTLPNTITINGTTYHNHKFILPLLRRREEVAVERAGIENKNLTTRCDRLEDLILDLFQCLKHECLMPKDVYDELMGVVANYHKWLDPRVLDELEGGDLVNRRLTPTTSEDEIARLREKARRDFDANIARDPEPNWPPEMQRLRQAHPPVPPVEPPDLAKWVDWAKRDIGAPLPPTERLDLTPGREFNEIVETHTGTLPEEAILAADLAELGRQAHLTGMGKQYDEIVEAIRLAGMLLGKPVKKEK